MKHAKKLASLLLALVMVFALATTAFAAGSGSITVDNPVSGANYTAYKIFDVVYNDGKTAYSYTIDSKSEWFTTVQNYANAIPSKGLTLTQVNGSTTYNVTKGDTFSAPDFAKALKEAVSGKTKGITLNVENGKATADGLDLGYYLVVGTKGADTEALANLTTTNPTVTIHDKNDMPFDKVDNKDSVDVGQTVNYTITGKVPDYTDFTTYTYLITDTMSEGLTFKKDVKVTVGGTDVTSACTVNYDVKENESDETGNANKFTVSVPVKNYTIGAEIEVTYSAVVNEKAVAQIAKNKAVLKYSNDPTDDTKFGTTPADEEKVYSSKIVIDKFEAGQESTKLANAKFVLYKRGDATTTKPTGVDYDTETNESSPTYYPRSYYKYTAATQTEGAKVEWVTEKTQATPKVTGENGAASFDGLANGTYYLEETAAPAGYNMLEAPVPVTVNGANATETNLSALTVTAEVANNTGALLPSTGGMGTTLFYVLGSVLVLGAVVLLVSKKRMGKAE